MTKHSLRFFVSVSAVAVLGSYLIAVLTSCYPFAFLQPSWQLNFATNVVDNGGIAVISLLLFAFAAALDQRNQPLQQRSLAIFRLAIWPLLGFLLLPGLFVFASIRLQEQVRSQTVYRIERAGRRIQQLAQRIQTAENANEVDLILRKFQGKGLSPQQKNLPLPVVRAQLLSQLKSANSQLLARIPAKQVKWPLPLIQTGLRIGLTSWLYAVALAALARRPKAQISLLEELKQLYLNQKEAASERYRSKQAFLKTIADSQIEQQALAIEQSLDASADEDTEISDDSSATSADSDPIDKPLNPAGSSRNRPVDFDYFDSLSRDLDDHGDIEPEAPKP